MLSLSKMGSEERKSRILYAENIFEPMEEDVMVNSVKVSAEIYRIEKRHPTIITSSKKVVQDSKQSSFSGVTSTISRSKAMPKFVCVQMIKVAGT